jgi:hypothetical protein
VWEGQALGRGRSRAPVSPFQLPMAVFSPSQRWTRPLVTSLLHGNSISLLKAFCCFVSLPALRPVRYIFGIRTELRGCVDFVDDSEVVYVAGHSVVRLDIENGAWRCVLVRTSACLRRTDGVCGWGAGGGGAASGLRGNFHWQRPSS